MKKTNKILDIINIDQEFLKILLSNESEQTSGPNFFLQVILSF